MRWNLEELSPLCLAVALTSLAGCCGSVAPPPSRLPDAASALARMHATYACSNAIKATNARVDYFGDRGRVKGDMSLFAARPARLRIDIFAPPPLSSSVDTLTSDGTKFALYDLREKKFYVGPASACNIARLTTVPVPGHVMVDLLRGIAPVLKHEPAAATLEWSNDGYYVLRVPSTRDAREEIHLKPREADWNKPWAEQALRVLDVTVEQEGFVLYHASLDEHAPVPTDQPLAPEFPGDDRAMPLSGPQCTAEVPRSIHVEVPDQNEDVRFRYKDLVWNPPLPDGTFTQPPPVGLPMLEVDCEAHGR